MIRCIECRRLGNGGDNGVVEMAREVYNCKDFCRDGEGSL